MSRDALLALADRCEAATGADRGIDCWVENHLGLARFEDDCPDRFSESWLTRRVEPKPYIASLDAALTLLDGDWFFHMSRFSADVDLRCEAHVYPNRGLGDDWTGDAATLPLALCAAALRARAESAS